MKRIFAPGCALTIENPILAETILNRLNRHMGPVDRLDTCCRNAPEIEDGTTIVNICAGCDKRYRENYPNCTTTSLWEIIDQTDFWDFPDYSGIKMSVLDPCPVRTERRVHDAVRSLLSKMNISVVEAQKIKSQSVCCGDTLWGKAPTEKVIEKMKERADQMPEDNVVVYCVSCIKSVANGGKTPRHLVDLLFNATTATGTTHPDRWHQELEDYIKTH